ncbi:hypothetical protein C8J57DRAFT_1365286 [Mycena rebaudengoi]|nr:hypothetical protein C8J57DRAFT_1365286 [Mycena rebaudengoi]
MPPLLPPLSAAHAFLPPYSAREVQRSGAASRRSTEHLFDLKDKKKKTWATLKLLSSAPNSATLPVFLEGDQIVGSLTLDIPSGENILGVTVFIRGEITTGPDEHDRLVFLDITTPLWQKESDFPAPPSRASSSSAKLSGDYHWPFSVDIPKYVVLPGSAESGTRSSREFRLPHTFLERGANVSVHYHLSVCISRRTFRADSELRTMFAYVAAIRPEPPSLLRQIAYQENSPIPGPEIDPEGWHSFPMTTLIGTVFNNRTVEVQCLLSLAKPLSYTRGSTIPCSMTYFCRDSQALNLICTPASTNVRLRRHINCQTLPLGHPSKHFFRQPKHHYTTSGNSHSQENGKAVWWPAKEGPPSHNSRKFEGEIQLAKQLKPTSVISHFSLRYFVEMLPPEVTGFSPSNKQPLIEQEVQIATILPKGPRPLRYAPSSHVAEDTSHLDEGFL